MSIRDQIAAIIADSDKDCVPSEEADRILNLVRKEIDGAIFDLSDALFGDRLAVAEDRLQAVVDLVQP